MKLLKNPWIEIFLKLCKEADDTIRITSPYVTSNICNQMINEKKPDTKLKLISSFKMPAIYNGFLDLNAIKAILNMDGVVKDHQMLHSKIYLFDKKCAVVTSGNLTYGGMKSNYEYGVMIEDSNMVSEIVNEFDNLFESKDCKNKDLYDINKLTNLLDYYKANSDKIELKKNFDNNSELDFNTYLKLPSNLISAPLRGWKLVIFNLIDEIPEFEFQLGYLYDKADILRALYPGNHNIKDKIRQQLQYLRDLGWIQFLDEGHYRKLWQNNKL